VSGPFEALADPVRRHLLVLLSGGEQPAGSLVGAVRRRTPISQPAVSQHLRVLREAGLVTVRAEGARRVYALDPSGVRRAQGWLAALTDPGAAYANPLDALATEVARGRRRPADGNAAETG
jgi:DNA-binding transcriptional ArsR family regulator